MSDSSEKDYSNLNLIRNNFPQGFLSADGTRTTEWHLTMSEDVPASTDFNGLSHKLSTIEVGYKVLATLGPGPRQIFVKTLIKEGWRDAIYYAADLKMLQLIETLIGPIAQIQGQPKELWRPFRN